MRKRLLFLFGFKPCLSIFVAVIKYAYVEHLKRKILFSEWATSGTLGRKMLSVCCKIRLRNPKILMELYTFVSI